MDSFNTVVLISKISSSFGVDLAPSKVRPAMSVAELSKIVHVLCTGGSKSTRGSNNTAEASGQPNQLQAEHATRSMKATNRPPVTAASNIPPVEAIQSSDRVPVTDFMIAAKTPRGSDTGFSSGTSGPASSTPSVCSQVSEDDVRVSAVSPHAKHHLASPAEQWSYIKCCNCSVLALHLGPSLAFAQHL